MIKIWNKLDKLPMWAKIKLINLWRPFRGAGIRVKSIESDFHKMRVGLDLNIWNRNIVGTQFGGSLYAMTDPFYMLMLMQILGPDYIVWDKAASINFKKPGKTPVYADFEWNEVELGEIKSRADKGEKVYFDKKVLIKNTDHEIISEVDKTLYIRKKY